MESTVVGELLSLEVQCRGPATVVIATGEIDMLTADRLRETLIAQMNSSSELLVVDLDGVGFLGSMGLTALALAQRVALERGVELRVVANSRATLRPLQITGMTADVAVYASRTEALAGHGGEGPDPCSAPYVR
jgi:anti-sigma B factor antagonist